MHVIREIINNIRPTGERQKTTYVRFITERNDICTQVLRLVRKLLDDFDKTEPMFMLLVSCQKYIFVIFFLKMFIFKVKINQLIQLVHTKEIRKGCCNGKHCSTGRLLRHALKIVEPMTILTLSLKTYLNRHCYNCCSWYQRLQSHHTKIMPIYFVVIFELLCLFSLSILIQ